MDLEKYKELKLKVENDLVVNETNAAEKSLAFARLYSKYTSLYLQELRLLKKMATEKDKLYGELYHEFKFKSDFQLDNRNEIDIYVKANERYYNKCLAFQNQEIVVKYLEETLQNITTTGYRIKNYVDLLKLKMGLK